MRLAPSKSKTPNSISQDLLVRMATIKDARVILQPNTPKNGIDRILPQRFGFLPSPKILVLIQSSRTPDTHQTYQTMHLRVLKIDGLKIEV